MNFSKFPPKKKINLVGEFWQFSLFRASNCRQWNYMSVAAGKSYSGETELAGRPPGLGRWVLCLADGCSLLKGQSQNALDQGLILLLVWVSRDSIETLDMDGSCGEEGSHSLASQRRGPSWQTVCTRHQSLSVFHIHKTQLIPYQPNWQLPWGG